MDNQNKQQSNQEDKQWDMEKIREAAIRLKEYEDKINTQEEVTENSCQ